MASEVFCNDGNELPPEIVKRLSDSEIVLVVRLDRKRGKLIFMGTNILTECLERGMPLEQYFGEKLEQVRKNLIKEN
jgi:hypothetical protein